MSDPNKLYYHKYINLKKTFEKMDIPDEDKEEFLKMIEIKHKRIHLTPQQKEKKWKQKNKKETELLNNLLAGIGQTK